MRTISAPLLAAMNKQNQRVSRLYAVIAGNEYKVLKAPTSYGNQSTGSANVTCLDPLWAINSYDTIKIYFGYEGETIQVFDGRVHKIRRPVSSAVDIDEASLQCVGTSHKLLTLDTSTPKYGDGYRGSANWLAPTHRVMSALVDPGPLASSVYYRLPFTTTSNYNVGPYFTNLFLQVWIDTIGHTASLNAKAVFADKTEIVFADIHDAVFSTGSPAVTIPYDDPLVGQITAKSATIALIRIDVRISSNNQFDYLIQFANEYDAYEWTRSKIIEDLLKIHGIAYNPAKIQATSEVVTMRSIAQEKLFDIIGKVAQPEFGLAGFDEVGDFYLRLINTAAAENFIFTEKQELAEVGVEPSHEEVINQVYVQGASTDPVRVVMPESLVKTEVFQIPANTIQVSRRIAIPTCISQTGPDSPRHIIKTVQAPIYSPLTTNPSGSGTGQGVTVPIPLYKDAAQTIQSPRNQNVSYSCSCRLTPQPNFFSVRKNAFYNFAVIYVNSSNIETQVILNSGMAAFNGGPQIFTFSGTVTPPAGSDVKSFIFWAYTQSGYEVFAEFPLPGQTNVITYTPLSIFSGDISNQVVITRRTDLMPTGSELTEYIIDDRNLALTDEIRVEIEVYGKRITEGDFPIFGYAVGDETSINTFGERTVELQNPSITSTARAQLFADSILAAGKDSITSYPVTISGDPRVQNGDICRLAFVSPALIAKFGALTGKLFIHSVRQDPGLPWKTSFDCIPINQAFMAIIESFGDNFVKQRAELQAAYMASNHLVEIETVTPPATIQGAGSADKSLYDVKLMSYKGEILQGVPNSFTSSYVPGEIAIMIYKDSDHSQPWLTGRAAVVNLNGNVVII